MFAFIDAFMNGFSAADKRLGAGDIDRAIEMVIADTDPRLRFVSGCRSKLRQPVIRSLLYVNKLVPRMPGPIELNRKAFSSDPQVNALFGAADDIQDLFSLSDKIKQFFRDFPDQDCVCAALAMYKKEKSVFGMELHGDIVRRGVAQKAVNYSGHWIGVYGCDVAEAREHFKWRGIHSLAACALERIANLKTTTMELRERRSLLALKLKELRTQHRGLEGYAEAVPEEAVEWRKLERELEQTEHRLNEAKASVGTLDDHLRQVCKVLSHPSRYLRVTRQSVCVNRMGIKVEQNQKDQGTKVVTAKVSVGCQPDYHGILVVFPRSEMRAEEYYDRRRRAYLSAI